MNDINTRIGLLITDLKLSKNQFARKIKSSSAMISKVTNQRTNFGKDILEKIFNAYPGLNAAWLLTGVGEMWINRSDIDGKILPNRTDAVSKYSVNVKILTEPEFLNRAQERYKIINDLYQRLIDIRVLLFQELNIKVGFSTQAESDLLNSLARRTIKSIGDENISSYPYENLDNDGKALYLQKTEECITLFTNTFFEHFTQFYKGIVIPSNAESRRSFLSERAVLTDQWKYTHYKKSDS